MGCGGSSTAKDDDGTAGRGSSDANSGKKNKVQPEQVVVEVASTQNGSAATTKGKGNRGTKGRAGNQQSQQSQRPPPKKRRPQGNREPVNEKGYKKKIRENLRKATKGNDLEELQNCIYIFEKNKLEDNGDLADAKDKLEYLSLRKEIRDAILRRHAGILEDAIAHVESSEYAGNLNHYVEQAKALLEHLRELDKYKHDILEMDQNTISEIHSYHHPPPCVHEVMTATYLILGHKEEDLREWTDVQALLGRIGKNSLLREVRAADTENLTEDTCEKVEKLQKNFTIEQIRIVSAGVATFYEWNENMRQKYDKDKQRDQNTQQRDQEREQIQQQQQQPNSRQQSKNSKNRRQNKG